MTSLGVELVILVFILLFNTFEGEYRFEFRPSTHEIGLMFMKQMTFNLIRKNPLSPWKVEQSFSAWGPFIFLCVLGSHSPPRHL